MQTHNKQFQNHEKIAQSERAQPFKNGRYFEDDASHVAVTVAVPPAKAFKFFRDFNNLPLF